MKVRRGFLRNSRKISTSGVVPFCLETVCDVAATRGFGGSTRGIPNRAARCLRLSSSSSSVACTVAGAGEFTVVVVDGSSDFW